jgi:hypothetical protein
MSKIEKPAFSLMDGMILDMVAGGKTPRDIAAKLGITAQEATKKAYELLDSEIVTDPDQRRKLNVYRLERLVDALWKRTTEAAEKDDIKNLREILNDLSVLQGLNKEQDEAMLMAIQTHQFNAYMGALIGLVNSFRMLAPDLMTPDQWQAWGAEQLESAKQKMIRGEIQ